MEMVKLPVKKIASQVYKHRWKYLQVSLKKHPIHAKHITSPVWQLRLRQVANKNANISMCYVCVSTVYPGVCADFFLNLTKWILVHKPWRDHEHSIVTTQHFNCNLETFEVLTDLWSAEQHTSTTFIQAIGWKSLHVSLDDVQVSL